MSIWTLNEEKREIKKLDKDIDTDILIIGAGITGLTTAYYLKEKNICVVDANLIGYGVTKNSTAKINYLQENIYSKIATSTSVYNAKKYLESQKYAINELKNIIENEKIICDFKKVPSYVFANTIKDIKTLNNEIKFLKKNNIYIEEKDLKINTNVFKSYYVNDTYIFNPIKYLKGLYNILTKKNINIYEKTKVLKIKRKNNKYICLTGNNKIIANKIVIACHYPFFLFPFITPIKCSIEKSYIIVSKVKDDKNLTCITNNNPVYSLRYYKDNNNIYQLSLSNNNDLSKNLNDYENFKSLQEKFNIKNKDIIMKYTNSDIMTPDYMPYIGRVKSNMYIGIGYNTWGMTNGVLSSKIISDNILGIENKFSEVFKPNRLNSQILIKIPYYIINNAKSFINSKLNKNRNINYYRENGMNLASYTDKNNVTHVIINKCPHLGCGLNFNEVELTWDCPCHSSRFDINGKCIKGPSNYDISYKSKM